MTVSINYMGRFGNHLFQYLAGRFIAEENGMKLNSPWVDHSILTLQEVSDLTARDGDGPFLRIGDEHGALDRKWERANYQLHGYFQIGRWYFERKKRILEILRLPPLVLTPPGDLVVNVRLGDYVSYNVVIHPSWYLGILEKEKFDRLILVTDEPGNPYLEIFGRYNPVLANGGPAEHFKILRNARRLVMSNSSFCWWAAFLGAAEKIYIFKEWLKNPDSLLGDFQGATRVDGDFLRERV